MNLETTAKGVAIFAALGVAFYVLWKGKQAVEAVAGAASDAIDRVKVVSNPKVGEAPAANWASRGFDAVLFGETPDAGGNYVTNDSLGAWLERGVEQVQAVDWTNGTADQSITLPDWLPAWMGGGTTMTPPVDRQFGASGSW